MKNRKVLKKIYLIFSMNILIFVIIGIFYIDNKNIDCEYFSLNVENSDNSDVKLKIFHLSDLHFPKIEVDINEVLQMIIGEKVDFVAITGDIIDRNADVSTCGVFEFVEEVVKIAPVYYVSGNHENEHFQEKLLYENLQASGVVILENESINVDFGGVEVTLVGLFENTNYNSKCYEGNDKIDSNYVVLLSHRPEKYLSYTANSNVIAPDLVLTGHAHGGQIRIFGQGVIAPNQGLFPKYDSGIYESNNAKKTKMIISRGLGNSVFPFRVNDKPHIPIISISF